LYRKKIECFRPEVAPFVDFIITFEELAAIFQAFNLDPTKIQSEEQINDASKLGRGFPVAGGVANAVIAQIDHLTGKSNKIPYLTADCLEDCLMLLNKLKKKQLDPIPLLIEGMECPFGCVGGPGTLAPLRRAQNEVKKFVEQANLAFPSEFK
jgi:iron only hydrogenase large subunit-like protein